MTADGVQETDRTVLLNSSDRVEFVVSELEASQSMTIKLEIRWSITRRYTASKAKSAP
jgi:hypothetical protein